MISLASLTPEYGGTMLVVHSRKILTQNTCVMKKHFKQTYQAEQHLEYMKFMELKEAFSLFMAEVVKIKKTTELRKQKHQVGIITLKTFYKGTIGCSEPKPTAAVVAKAILGHKNTFKTVLPDRNTPAYQKTVALMMELITMAEKYNQSALI